MDNMIRLVITYPSISTHSTAPNISSFKIIIHAASLVNQNIVNSISINKNRNDLIKYIPWLVSEDHEDHAHQSSWKATLVQQSHYNKNTNEKDRKMSQCAFCLDPRLRKFTSFKNVLSSDLFLHQITSLTAWEISFAFTLLLILYITFLFLFPHQLSF